MNNRKLENQQFNISVDAADMMTRRLAQIVAEIPTDNYAARQVKQEKLDVIYEAVDAMDQNREVILSGIRLFKMMDRTGDRWMVGSLIIFTAIAVSFLLDLNRDAHSYQIAGTLAILAGVLSLSFWDVAAQTEKRILPLVDDIGEKMNKVWG